MEVGKKRWPVPMLLGSNQHQNEVVLGGISGQPRQACRAARQLSNLFFLLGLRRRECHLLLASQASPDIDRTIAAH